MDNAGNRKGAAWDYPSAVSVLCKQFFNQTEEEGNRTVSYFGVGKKAYRHFVFRGSRFDIRDSAVGGNLKRDGAFQVPVSAAFTHDGTARGCNVCFPSGSLCGNSSIFPVGICVKPGL